MTSSLACPEAVAVALGKLTATIRHRLDAGERAALRVPTRSSFDGTWYPLAVRTLESTDPPMLKEADYGGPRETAWRAAACAIAINGHASTPPFGRALHRAHYHYEALSALLAQADADPVRTTAAVAARLQSAGTTANWLTWIAYLLAPPRDRPTSAAIIRRDFVRPAARA